MGMFLELPKRERGESQREGEKGWGNGSEQGDKEKEEPGTLGDVRRQASANR